MAPKVGTNVAFLFAVLACFVISVMSTSFEDQKNYYLPHDPQIGTPPAGSSPHYTPTPTPYHGTTPTPHHGTTPTPHHGTTPSHHTPSTPSHGGGSSTPNCGTPPASHGATPSTPSGHGGYYHSPPTSGHISPPTTPVIVTPPVTTPSTPIPTIPSPPFDPNSFPGTCNYWKSHPGLVWGVLGWWGTVGNAFGHVSSVPGLGSTMSIPDALSNKRTDGFGALYREGTASWLNSMVNKKFPYTTQQVRDSFATALGSDKAAAAQAQLFKLANEGHLKL